MANVAPLLTQHYINYANNSAAYLSPAALKSKRFMNFIKIWIESAAEGAYC